VKAPRSHQQPSLAAARSLVSHTTKNGLFESPNFVDGTSKLPPLHRHSNRSNRPTIESLVVSPNHNASTTNQTMVSVSAIHMAQTIELKPLLISSVLERYYATQKQQLGKTSIVVRLSLLEVNNKTDTSSMDELRYVAIYRFGSMVFFNVPPDEVERIVQDVKRLATTTTAIAEDGAPNRERHEKFGVFVAPELFDTLTGDAAAAVVGDRPIATVAAEEPVFNNNNGSNQISNQHHHNSLLSPPPLQATVTGDYCIVPELDMNGVAVISNIMAQTVALDSYNDRVDELLAQFAKINNAVTRTGSFSAADKSFLFKTVAQNNGIFIDMISKIRIKDRSDTAWNLTKYETIHYGLKEEFEIDDRFDHVSDSVFFLAVYPKEGSAQRFALSSTRISPGKA